MLNFRHVEVFHAVYTNGSVSGAARALKVAQPTVSKVLRHAESLAGFPLFHRAAGKLVPTEEAHALFQEVDEIHARMLSLRDTTRNMGRRANTHIRFAALPGIGLEIAPHAVAAFRRSHPNVTFDIQTRHTADFLRVLQEKEFDLVIGYEAPTDPRLAHQDIGESELVLLCRREDLSRLGERPTLDVVERHDFISMGADSGPIGRLLSNELARQDLHPREIISISTSYIAASLVRFGLGITIVDAVTARALQGTDLVSRSFSPPLKFSMCCITLADRPLSKLVRRFVQTLRDAVKALAADADRTG